MNRSFISKRKKLGEIVVTQGRMTPEQLTEYLRIQKETGQRMGQILIESEILTEEELTNLLAEQLGIPYICLRKGLVDPRIVRVLPKEKALLFQVIPLFRVYNMLTLAIGDPYALFVFDEVSKITGMKVQPVICRVDDILGAIKQYYQADVDIDEMVGGIDETPIDIVQTPIEKEITELAEMAEGSPVINLINKILLKSIRDEASDIHIEPHPGKCRVRIRIDGILYELLSPYSEMHPALVSRLKIMANLDIAERRLPQDGRIQVKVDDRKVDLRFSSMPGIHGEKVVLRILDQRKAILDINKLGFEEEELDKFKSVLRKSHGLILVCGPTGSGKTSTLYSAITLLNTLEKNIVTIEDPVEYQLDIINQNQVKESISLTFAKILRHILRQDPDIIMVGEIRDRETAEIAVQASLTGHLVLSTLHTNDCASAITRLLEMGIEPYLISSSLLASLGQRLLRTVCPECKTQFYPPKAILKELGFDENEKIRLFRGQGCTSCYDSGFKGRIGIYEVLVVDGELQSLILTNPNFETLQESFKQNGHRALKELGYKKIIDGNTTVEEVIRVTNMEAN
jgi:type IV pilus assembly protein PilB